MAQRCLTVPALEVAVHWLVQNHVMLQQKGMLVAFASKQVSVPDSTTLKHEEGSMV